MELGALICSPKQAQCDRCPIANQCIAFRDGKVHRIPRLIPRPQTVRRYFAAFVLERKGRFLVRQRPANVVNAHLWEFPSAELTRKNGDLMEVAKTALGTVPDKLEPLCEINHSITRYRIRLQVFKARYHAGQREGRWFASRKLVSLPFSSAHGKILQFVLGSSKLRVGGTSRSVNCDL